MTIGATIGFVLARAIGRPLAARLVEPRDLDRMELLTRRFGPKTLVLCRALPVLAEASVLLVGAMRLPWLKFFVPSGACQPGNRSCLLALGQLFSRARPAALGNSWLLSRFRFWRLRLMHHRLGASNDDSRAQRQSEMKTGTGSSRVR